MQLVDGSINPDCDLQSFLAASLPHPVDDTGESGAAHLSGPCGNALTHQSHNITVQLRGENAQRGQDVVDLFSVPSITERRKYILLAGFMVKI